MLKILIGILIGSSIGLIANAKFVEEISPAQTIEIIETIDEFSISKEMTYADKKYATSTLIKDTKAKINEEKENTKAITDRLDYIIQLLKK